MRLYLIRHAYAGEHGDPRYPDDSLRPVTSRGKKDFTRLVKWLVGRDACAPQVLGTSPYLRCVQTAELLADRLSDDTQVQPVPQFEPGATVADVLGWLATQPHEELAYVGHAPDIEHIAAGLLGTNTGSMRFPKGAIMALDLDRDSPTQATLRWLITPKLVG
jgi:phosphohistidine phosphatase